jgi:hypothetical protein
LCDINMPAARGRECEGRSCGHDYDGRQRGSRSGGSLLRRTRLYP